MQLRGIIDCLIPRGGHSLIEAVMEHATVPYVIDGDGNCHVYVEPFGGSARWPPTSWSTPRPSGRACATRPSHWWCTAAVAEPLLRLLADRLDGVELRARRRTPWPSSDTGLPSPRRMTIGREFLDLILSVRVVGGLDEAIAHITRVLVRPHRGDRHQRPGCGARASSGRWTRRRGGQRVNPLHRRGGVRLRGRDRHQHPEAPRPRPDGARGAHHYQVPADRERPGQGLAAGSAQPSCSTNFSSCFRLRHS